MTPIQRLIDDLMREQEERHAWIKEAAKQIRKWRDEDLREGVVWDAE